MLVILGRTTSAGLTIKACVIDHYALGEGWENFVRKRLPNATFWFWTISQIVLMILTG